MIRENKPVSSNEQEYFQNTVEITEEQILEPVKEGFSKGEYRDGLDEQKLEAVTGGANPLMGRYLSEQLNLVSSTLLRPELRRTRSAPAVPNFYEYRRTSISREG